MLPVLRLSTCAAVIAALTSCTVGPDYAGPPDIAPVSMTRRSFKDGSTAKALEYPVSEWWTGVRDPDLTKAIQTALARSPNVDIGVARLRQARAQLMGSRAALLPQVSNSSAALRTRLGLGDTSEANQALSAAGSAVGVSSFPALPDHLTTNLYSVSFDASWEIDIFGGRRRAVEGAVAQVQAAEADFADVHVQLSSEVARAYVGLRAAQRQLDIAQRAVSLQEKTLELTQQKAAQGTASELDLARLETQLATTRADVPSARAQVDEAWNQLSLLLGMEPGGAEIMLSKSRPIPKPPAVVALGDPAAMLRRRPDIRQAERQLAASNAAIGQAVAGYFPRVTLLGLASSGSTDAGDLFHANSVSLIGGPTLQWNILDFGRNHANVENANAAFTQSLAQYRSTILSALQDAETSLSRYRNQRRNLAELSKASAAASRAASLARDLNQAGTLSLIDTLDVERQRLQSERAATQAEAQFMDAFVALEKSLGLGWKPVPAVTNGPATVRRRAM